MTDVAVLVPWSGNCPHRAAAWQWVGSWYATHHPDWQIIRGLSGTGSMWCKAEAVALALQHTDAEILVVADADCVTPEVGIAVQQVASGVTWAVPHDKVHRFSRLASDRIRQGLDPALLGPDPRNYNQRPYRGLAGGGVVVLSRKVYRSAPLDPSFRGWGQEDQAWALALRTLHGEGWRSEAGPLWHLWHPPQARVTRVKGSQESWNIYRSYELATTPQAMENLLARAHTLVENGL